MSQQFSIIDTNDAALTDAVLYNACTAIPDDTNTTPSLQIAEYGADSIIIKASHFDFSMEAERDFALLVCDTVDKPIWKTIDLSGSSDAQDGWLVQGLVANWKVTDPMYFQVTNVIHDANSFYRAIPYSGPVVTLSGAQSYDVVSNSITLHADITDLSGTTNQQLTLLADGVAPRYSIGASNTITIDTHYTPNGYVTLSAAVDNHNARPYGPTNAPMDTKLDFVGTGSLPLDFENSTFVAFPSDLAETDIQTNYFVFGVTPPQYIKATIKEPVSGRIIRTFSGYDDSYGYVQLDWNFTEADGVTAYTNDDYVVSFTASDNAISGKPVKMDAGGSTTVTYTNKIQRTGVRTAGWVISSFEEMRPSSYSGSGTFINNEFARWYGAYANMYEHLYHNDFASLPQYFAGQIGVGRDTPTYPSMPLVLNPSSQATWPSLMRSVVTNSYYSDFNYGGHGNSYAIGGGEWMIDWLNYVTVHIDSSDMADWVRVGTSDKRRKMRKVAMWACMTGMIPKYAGWRQAFGIDDTQKQLRSLEGKNAGLFFVKDLYFASYGSPATDVAEVANFFEQIWTMGAYPYPGGADPNYSIQFALDQTEGVYPEIMGAVPWLEGYPFLPFAGVYDDQLMVGDYSQVKTYPQ